MPGLLTSVLKVNRMGVAFSNKLQAVTQLAGFTRAGANWVIQWRFALFEPLRASRLPLKA